jgi:Xaa-Pro aminopeptidase
MTLKKAPEPKGYEVYGPEPTLPDFPHSEWKARIDKIQGLMRKENIDLLMLWGETNTRYFTGFTSTHWRLASLQPLVALIPVEDAPLVIAPELFRWTAEAQSWVRDIRCQGGDIDQHSEENVRNLPREVAATVREMGYGKASIALEMGREGNMYIPRPLNDIQMLLSELPEARFVDGDRVIWRCRQIKSPLEIERLTKAAEIHRGAVSDVVHQYRPGMTESDVGKIFICSAYQNGAETVMSGSIRCGPEKEGLFDVKHSFNGLKINKDDYIGLDICSGLSSPG